MTIDADEEKEIPGEEERVGNAVLDAGRTSVKGNELMVDVDQNDEDERELQALEVLQVQQQQSQGAVAAAVCWERFLHIRSIKVLLVENDDSTRHVVTALLRNCNYEVIEAAIGVQAWRILEDLNNHVDIVLTEVVMPCLSGIGLLCKIMSHKTRKNIPVIMMSSHDSMGLVFSCLSKGAVDFLVKPIRKNELKNLWQHVWRRCHSSSGSGSESGIRTQNSASEDSEKSANNNGSYGLNKVDDASGTQTSWTQQPVDIDSPQAASPLDQVAECPDSTCAQVIRPNVEIYGNNTGHMKADGEQQEEEISDHITGCKDLVPRTSANLEQLPENPVDVTAKLICTKHSTLLEVPLGSCSIRMTNEQANTGGEFQSNVQDTVNTESDDPQIAGSDFEPPRELTNKLEPKNDLVTESKEAPIELSLNWLKNLNDKGKSIEDNLSVLKHFELSTFSRYNTSSNALRTPNDITGSSCAIDNSSEVKKNSVCDAQIHSNENNICQSSKAVSNINMDMSSATNKFPVNPLFLTAESTSTINVRGLNQEHQLQHPQPYHLHQHHFHNFEQQQALSNHEKSTLKTLGADSPHCGSLNVLAGLGDGNPGNCSLNRSASGSNYGSNGQNGSSNAVNTWGTNGEGNMGVGGRSGSGKVHGSVYGNRTDQDKLAQRKVALSMFRKKRKERCFKKKVGYPNQKRLAEQWPGVHGDFARQDDHEDSNNSTDD